MQILIASDNHTMATKLRHILAHRGFECPVGNVASLEDAKGMLRAANRDPDLVLLVLPDDAERSRDELRVFRGSTAERLIVIGNGSNAGNVLEAVHAGADDFLDEHRDLAQQLSGALDRMSEKLADTANKGRLTAITAPAGGSGASTVAANLSVLAARSSGNCALLDLDPRGGVLDSFFNLKPQHSIADLCRNIDNLDGNMFEQSLSHHSSGVSLLAAGQRSNDRETVTPDRLRRIVSLARSVRSEFLVDLPDPTSDLSHEVLRHADRIVVVFRLEFPALKNLRRILDEWQERDIDLHQVGLLANRCGLKHELPVSKVENILGKKVTSRLADDPGTMNLSVNCGSPVVIESPRTPTAKSLEQIAQELGLQSSETQAPTDSGGKLQNVFSRIAGITRTALNPRLARASE